ncbi:MAG: hypothetical protein ACOYWZ_21450 [Bacillota bacterium]
MENNYENQSYDTEVVEPNGDEAQAGCKCCSGPYIEEGYNLELCVNCRDMLAKRPIPVWIKVFSVVILAMLVFTLSRFPSVIQAGVAYERGLAAEKGKNYSTASIEYKKASEKFSDSTLVLAKLCVAQYYNMQIEEAINTFGIIAGRQDSDEDLVEKVNSVIDKIEKYYSPSEEVAKIMQANANAGPEKLQNELEAYLSTHPNDVFVSTYVADKKFEEGKFEEAEKILYRITSSNSDFQSGNLLMAAIYREIKDYDKAIEYCQKILDINAQSTQALGSMARIELKRGNDSKGLSLATKAYNINNNDPYTVANMALAYHFNNMMKERDEMFERFKSFKDIDEYNLNLLTSIFNGEKWR